MKIRDHVHQWMPVSREVNVLVDGACMFVCKDCPAFTIRKMKRIYEI